MRVISTHELSNLTRAQLFSLLVQFHALLSDLPEGTPEHGFIATTLTNIRIVLARRQPSP
jgi:hypothetical protein